MMVLKIDPKLVETMLAVAKGEHAVALHNIKEDEPTEDGVPVPNIEEELEKGGPRGPKRPARAE